MTVCLANRARSPTAEWLLHKNYRVKSCGTAEFDATKPCDKYDMKWADRVLVMEPYQKTNLEQRFPNETAGKVEVLDVPEVGKYSCQPSLIEEIARRLEEHHLRVRNIKHPTLASFECGVWTSNMADRKMRGQMARTHGLEEYAEFGGAPYEPEIITQPTEELAPWQIEEREAFERARALPRGQGGITRVTEDEKGLSVWYGDKEMTDEEIQKEFDRITREEDRRDEERRMAQKFEPWHLRAEDFATGTDGKTKTQKKVMDELKKYADSVKEFFK